MRSRALCAWLSCASLLLASPIASAADEPAEKPSEVDVVRPVVMKITDYEDFTGRTEASSRVDLRARATGYLTRVLFQEGSDVKQDDTLLEIDPRPYQAQLDQARAQGTLAQAQLTLAEKTLAR